MKTIRSSVCLGSVKVMERLDYSRQMNKWMSKREQSGVGLAKLLKVLRTGGNNEVRSK